MDSNDNRGMMAEINVTPLVDVMLVLLVIFMVTAPMMQQGVQVNLPKADTKAMTPQEETVVVTVDKSGKIFINKDEIPAADLRSRLSTMFASRDQERGLPQGRCRSSLRRSGQGHGRHQGCRYRAPRHGDGTGSRNNDLPGSDNRRRHGCQFHCFHRHPPDGFFVAGLVRQLTAHP